MPRAYVVLLAPMRAELRARDMRILETTASSAVAPPRSAVVQAFGLGPPPRGAALRYADSL